ncbi:MAG: glycoside hydrolase family 2 protein [Clostridia bacterium]
MEKINLNGIWLLEEIGGSHKCEATIPSSNFVDLERAKIIPDPLVGMNENAVQWVAKSDWQYSREFDVDSECFGKEKFQLVCEMLDTICEIFVNGQLVGKGNNINRTYIFDIKKAVKIGKNNIQVKFFSPFEYIAERQKLNPLPNATMGEAGSCHLRKSPYHFGWDWGPHLLPCGISRNICIKCFDNELWQDVVCAQTHNANKVTCHIDGKLTNSASTQNNAKNCVKNNENSNENCVKSAENINENINGNLSKNKGNCRIEYQYTLSFEAQVVAEYFGENNRADLEVTSPHLWWCNGLGKQPLYSLECKVFFDGQLGDTKTMQIGLREIKLDLSKDEFGSNFCFEINGEKIFARGANWIATDSFVNKTTPKALEEIIVKAKVANFNMLRVWGGAYYESDKFYDLCDKNGILVWQDCNFACSPYPFGDEEFCQNVKQEIVDNVARLRHHASLCLWCGNNEIESMSLAWAFRRDIIAQTGEFFYKTLREWVTENDKVTPYWACTPSSGEYMKKVNNDACGDTHLWHVWHGLRPLDFYRKRFTRFCSEYGIESLPSENALDIFAGDQAKSLDTPVMKLHQKCDGGNSKMLFYTLARYWQPKQFEDTVYLSQLAQMECVREATEHWRRNKGRCNGSLYWQYNDCWGVSSWSGMDYYGNQKAVQYMAKHFNKSLCVTVENTEKSAKIFVHNDTLQAFDGVAKWGIESFDGELLASGSKGAKLEKGQVKQVEEVVFGDQIEQGKFKNSFFFVDLTDKDGQSVSSRSMPLLTEKKCDFARTHFVLGVEVLDGLATISLQSATYARYVYLRMKGSSKPFGDNFFDLRPNKIKTVTIAVPENWTKDDVEQALVVKSLCNVEAKSSRFVDKLTRAKIFLMPVNFVNWIARFFDN